MSHEQRVRELGIDIPDYNVTPYPGSSIGTMKSHHITGNLLFLSGHIPVYPDGRSLHPGIVGKNVTLEQGYAAARLTGIHVVAGIKFALGDLDRVVSIINTLNFVVCTPEFTDVPLVSNGCADLLVEVFGRDAGLGARATIGVNSLHDGVCFETWVTVEIRA